MDRRTLLTGTATVATAALAGCTSNTDQNNQNSEDTPNNTGEFSIEEFLIEGEQPQEYEAEFIAGLNPEEVAGELTPEIQYQLQSSSEVETEFQHQYTDETIPQEEPLNETIEGETHNDSGEYTQNTPMPQELAAEVLQNPKNIKTTFEATDTETGQTETQEYEINLADSYIEQIQEEHFSQQNLAISNATPKAVNVEEGIINLEYESNHEIGSHKFNLEMGNIAGLYTTNIKTTKTPYHLNLRVKDSTGQELNTEIKKDRAESYLREDEDRRSFQRDILFNKLVKDD